MSYKTFLHVGRETIKGDAIHQLSQAAAGVYDTGVLRLSADVLDREQIHIGEDKFELVVLNTAIGGGVVSANLDNTNAVWAVETFTAHGLVVGAILRCESEFLRVEQVRDVNTVALSRGYAGSTIASHADGTAVVKAAVTALAASTVVLPLGATLTPAAAGPQIATGVTALNGGGFTAVYASEGLFVSRPAGDTAFEVVETLSGANNAWAASSFANGIPPGETKFSVAARVPTATDVALGVIRFVLPFAPTFVRVTVQVTSSRANKAWDGAYTISGNTVIVDNAGSTDWATTDTVTLEAHGN